MTAFLQVREAIVYCSDMEQLSAAWKQSQYIIKTIDDQGQIKALVAMKDFYKGMIDRGVIHDYLRHRKEAAAKNWTGAQIPEQANTNGLRMVRQQGRTSKVSVSS
jgi:hypothetical protein